MAGNPRNANSARRKRDRTRLAAECRPCWICRAFGRPGVIDYTLPPGHPLAFEMDELVPISRGGPPTYENADAAHRCCNEWRGNRTVEEVRRIAAAARGEAASKGMTAGDDRPLPLPPSIRPPAEAE